MEKSPESGLFSMLAAFFSLMKTKQLERLFMGYKANIHGEKGTRRYTDNFLSAA